MISVAGHHKRKGNKESYMTRDKDNLVSIILTGASLDFETWLAKF